MFRTTVCGPVWIWMTLGMFTPGVVVSCRGSVVDGKNRLMCPVNEYVPPFRPPNLV